MIKHIRQWLENEFFRNVMILFSGSAVAQIIPLLSMIVLTRLYPEEAFGVFFVYAAAGIVLAILGTLKYELAVVLPSSDNAGFRLLLLSFFISFVVSLLGLLFIVLFFQPIQALLAEKNIGKWMYYLPLSMFFTGMLQSTVFWFNRNKQYNKISGSRIVKALFMSVFQILGGVIGAQNSGLIHGLIAGQAAAALYVLFLLLPDVKKYWAEVRVNRLFEEGKKHLNIPLFNTLMGLLNNLSNQLPVFLLSRFFGAKIVAYYGLANRMISVPMGLIGQSVGQVFFQDAAKISNEHGNLYKLVLNVYKKLFGFALIPFSALFFMAPWLFSLLFGAAWEISGLYTRILVPWLFLMFLNAPISYLITILNKQRNMTVYQVLLLASRFVALYLGYAWFGTATAAILMFSGVGFVFNLFLINYQLYLAKKYSHE